MEIAFPQIAIKEVTRMERMAFLIKSLGFTHLDSVDKRSMKGV
jgi:hypothetical protein